MARPRYGSTRRPNTTAIRVKPETKTDILQLYRNFIHGDSTMPIGDKLQSVLDFMRKKEEALEAEIRRLDEQLDLAEVMLKVRNKPIEVIAV